MEEILNINNLDISFGEGENKTLAVRGVSLEVYRGEALCLVGESGSGKSLTGKAILGILPESATVNGGEILYCGENLLKLKEAELDRIRGKRISAVPQDPFTSLNPIMRVWRQIVEGVSVGGKKAAYEYAVSLMKEVGIDRAEERAREYPHRFSGGMRQRIAIATALARNPELIICDEPTTALDVTIEAQILDLFLKLKKERNASLLFITHDLGVVARIADRVAVMYAGRIVECGRVEEIFYEPKHPYTWALLSSLPVGDGKRLSSIGGRVPTVRAGTVGDVFRTRNKYALEIDYKYDPPRVDISDTHYVYSWLYHEYAPRVEMPDILRERIEKMKGKK